MDRFKDAFREDVKLIVNKYRSAPILLDDDSIVEVLDDISEDLEIGHDIPPY